MYIRIPILLLCHLVTSCNHVFYYPDSAIRLTPKILGETFTEYDLPVTSEESIHLWHIKSRNKNQNAIVIHFHGNAENMSTHVMYVAWLAQQGFDVITFDYRGYGKSKGTPSRDNLIQDGKTVLNWVGKQEMFFGKKIHVFGQSLGGAVAIPCVVMTSVPRLETVVVDSAFDSYRTIAREKLAAIWLTWPLQYPLSFLVSDDYSPIDYVGKLRARFLVIHSRQDPVVPYEDGERLFLAAPAAQRTMWALDVPAHTAALVAIDSPYRSQLTEYFIPK